MSNNPHGIDISKHQQVGDWNAVRQAGYEFAYIKATEGTGYVSPSLDDQINGARGAGMTTGLYHFARPDTNAAEDEAAAFAQEVKRLGADAAGNLSPCLDVERQGGNLPKWIGSWIGALREELNRGDVMVYASATWFREKLDPNSWYSDGVNLWVAHYGPPPGQPEFTEHVAMHQYTSDGNVPGIGGRTDLNALMVDMGALTGAQQPKRTGGFFSRLFGR